MQGQKQIHAFQLWYQGLNDVTFSHAIPLHWRLKGNAQFVHKVGITKKIRIARFL